MKTTTIFTLWLFACAANARAAGPADLIRLYEEEILAHDLYVALGKAHPELMPLQNIPRSEQMHRNALAAVLQADGIQLPEPPPGRRFVTAGLDDTFNQWLTEGTPSAADACRVGVRLEDHDIAELRQAQADFPAHKEVLSRLEAASDNHLRAFHRNLASRGGAYTPEALSEADFKAILEGADNPGGGGGCGQAGCGCAKVPAAGAKGKGKGKAKGKAKVPQNAKPKRKGKG